MAEIIVDQTDLNLTITPNTTQLNVFTGGYACAQGNTTEFQYNNGGVLAGANGLTYNSGSQTTTAANLTVTNETNLGAVGNVTITGGNVGDVLQTDGAGGLSFGNIANANYANFAGTVLTNAQPNITSVGNLSNLTVTGNASANFFIGNGSQLTGIGDGTQISNGTSNVRVLSANGDVSIGVNGNANILVANSTGITVTRANLGNASNLTIIGGVNGYFLQTDGTGNLTWAAGGNVSGNGVPGGANTQIQFNDGGSFGGKAGFTFNRNTNLLNAPGAITAVGNVQGLFIKGDGGLLSNLPGANGSFIANGTSNVSIATTNGNVTISVASNANIVTVTGTGMNVAGYANITGNVSGGNANLGNAVIANYFIGNFYGTANNATTANSATTAGTVTTAAQPNITSVGNLTSLNITGTTSLYEAIEDVQLIANQTGTYNFNMLDGSIQYATANATANLILNFRGNSTITANTMLANGKSITSTYIMTTGSTGYNISTVQVDGANTTINWAGNTVPLAYSNTKQSYTFTLIKTSTTPSYVVLGNFTRYG